MRLLILLSLCTWMLVASAGSLEARVWLILEDGTGDAPTIQAGLDSAAAEGDTVLIGPGTYLESPTVEDKALVILSKQGSTSTVVQSTDDTPALTLSLFSHLSVTVTGLTLTAPASGGLVVGGGIYSGSEYPQVNDCVIASSRWGVQIQYGAIATLTGCVIRNNTYEGIVVASNAGGGFHQCEIRNNGGSGIEFDEWGVSLTDCVVRENGGSGLLGHGGSSSGAHATIENCEISANAQHGLAADRDWYGPDVEFVVTHSTIADNTMNGVGVIYSTLQLEDCAIRDNGIYAGNVGGGQITLDRCVVTGNAAGLRVGASDLWGGTWGRLTFRSSTFHGNGSGLRAFPDPYIGSADLTVENSIVSGTESGMGLPYCTEPWLSYSVHCTDIFGNAGGDSLCPGVDGGGNFSADPLFCDAAGGDFTLAEDSPCAPANTPPGCDLIGALPVGCLPATVAEAVMPAARAIVRVAPHPIRDHGFIDLPAAMHAPFELRLYDSAGRLVANREVASWAPGRRSVAWERVVGVAKLASGVYFLEVRAGTALPPAHVPVVVIR